MEFLNNSLFGVILSLGSFEIGRYLFKKTKFPLFNPLLVATIIIISIIYFFNIPLDYYTKGGDIIEFFLIPATVLLALPLYRQRNLLKKYWLPILIGGVIGSLTAIVSIIFFSKLLKLDKVILISFIPKSITTPIGIAVSSDLGGIPALTIFAILLTGIIGNILASKICHIFKIKHPVAKGVAIGISSHAVGTSKAIEMGEIEGAMSALSIVVAGIITVILTQFMKYLHYL
jgi:predicted murein hydrolase (TIGR00659 family)